MSQYMVSHFDCKDTKKCDTGSRYLNFCDVLPVG